MPDSLNNFKDLFNRLMNNIRIFNEKMHIDRNQTVQLNQAKIPT